MTTTIIRHRRENLKKCSLQPLVGRKDLSFITYPLKAPLSFFPETIVLTLGAPPLTSEDKGLNLLLIDATWTLAAQIEKSLTPFITHLQKRSLPSSLITAYPRRQTGCIDPERGLASIEALYAAYRILGYDTRGLLDHYHWRQEFLDRNQFIELESC